MTNEPKQPGVTPGSQNTPMHHHFEYDEDTEKLISRKLLDMASDESIEPHWIALSMIVFMSQIKCAASSYVMHKTESDVLPDLATLASQRSDMVEKFTTVRDEICKHIDIDLWLNTEIHGDFNLRELVCQLFLDRRITFHDFSRIICHEVLTHKIYEFSEPSFEEIIKEETKRSTKHRDEFLKVSIEAVASFLDKKPSDLKIWEDGEFVDLLVLALEPPAKLVGDAFGSSTVYKSARRLMED